MKQKLLYMLIMCLAPTLVASQISVQRSFQEIGSVSTGYMAAVSTYSNGDVLLVNDRWTNFSQKGLQLFRLNQDGLTLQFSRAYYNDFTVTKPYCVIVNDTAFVLASHNNGGVNKLLFMVFDPALNLVRSSLIESDHSLIPYAFYRDPNGTFRLFGAAQMPNISRRFVISINPNGSVNWSKAIGTLEGKWGGASMLKNGSILFGSSNKYFVVNRDGAIVKVNDIGNDFSYTTNGMASPDGSAWLVRSGYDSALYYGVKVDASGAITGQSSGAWMNRPEFSVCLPNGHLVIGSSSFADNAVYLKLSEFNSGGVYQRSIMIDNVYGFFPGGALRDVCNYNTHVDDAGNLYVIGTANRQGFFILRLNELLQFDCAHELDASQPSPVPEPNPESFLPMDLNLTIANYPFTEEAPGNFKPVCRGCGGSMSSNLRDTVLCTDSLVYTLDPGNPGSVYLWDDGSTSRTRTITQSGTYWVRMSNDCDSLVDTVTVELLKKPKIKASYSPDRPIPGEPIQLTLDPSNYQTMQWWTNDTLFHSGADKMWQASKNGNYRFIVKAFDDVRCQNEDTLDILVALLDYYFPTAFSPNDDGINEVWGPVGSGIQSYHLEIYNRWGQRVFESDNQVWDGKQDHRPVSDGLYLYFIWIIDDEGHSRYHHGNITVIH
ncbi:MAG: gliding motility-associated C-terminal domain-containing protein [Bacteroidota bacterium]|nr:gliding motility-associated C-terminal domain-containing protein [Bacteroidota bacterium]MDX5429632.1 gliding motility-associated C-terminal domain-containing protein [Bacteroidota bacterium]MDX5468416.1 gliding motility-associated C-terminal domain-containing protein [Bacteroidota bacterium]